MTTETTERLKTSSDLSKSTCSKCGILGHDSTACRHTGRMCYNCGSFEGHLSSNCPEPPTEYTIRARAKVKQTSKRTGADQRRAGTSAIPRNRKTKRGIRMPYRQALKSKDGNLNLTIDLDSDTEDLPFDQQMCWVLCEEPEEDRGHSVAAIATDRPKDQLDPERSSGALMSLFE
ncbi:unnamed protein product, partial [Nesidiocoris tenuis]